MEMWDVSDVYVTSVTEFVIVMRIFIYLKKKTLMLKIKNIS